MTTAAEERRLLELVAEGDHDAFTKVMEAHEDRIFSVCLRILSDRENALDATQETFITVFRKASQFEGKAAVGTWIYRIAVNTCYDQLRKAKRRKTTALPDHYDPADPFAEETVESAGMRPEIRSALAKVPRDFRAAIVLADIEGLGLPEVGKALGVPVGTVKSRLYRGRRILARHIGNQTDT